MKPARYVQVRHPTLNVFNAQETVAVNIDLRKRGRQGRARGLKEGLGLGFRVYAPASKPPVSFGSSLYGFWGQVKVNTCIQASSRSNAFLSFSVTQPANLCPKYLAQPPSGVLFTRFDADLAAPYKKPPGDDGARRACFSYGF